MVVVDVVVDVVEVVVDVVDVVVVGAVVVEVVVTTSAFPSVPHAARTAPPKTKTITGTAEEIRRPRRRDPLEVRA